MNKLSKKIEDLIADFRENKQYSAADKLESLLKLAKNDGWTPCSEELPPKPVENPVFDNRPLELYLVSIRADVYPMRLFWNGEHFTDGFGKVDVEAWMPLPEPYKGGVDDEM